MNTVGALRTEAPPDHLYIELTDRCNLRCKHCYLSAGPGGENILDGALVQRTLSDFAALGGYSVAFSGGEPLMYPHLQSTLAHARAIGLTCTLVTNGTLLHKEAILTLLSEPVTIAFSLEGARPETHDAIRGKGKFARAKATLDKLVEWGAQERVVICFTPTHQNVRELTALATLLTDAGFRYLYISLLEERGRERSNTSELSLDLEDRVQLLTQLAFLQTQPDSQLQIDTGHLKYFFERLLQSWDGFGDPIEGTLRITSGGQVFLTAYVDDEGFMLGDLNQDSLRACWKSERVERLFTEAHERALALRGCADCPYWIVCGGGSPARAFAVHGCFMEPDDFCEAKQLFLEEWYRSL